MDREEKRSDLNGVSEKQLFRFVDRKAEEESPQHNEFVETLTDENERMDSSGYLALKRLHQTMKGQYGKTMLPKDASQDKETFFQQQKRIMRKNWGEYCRIVGEVERQGFCETERTRYDQSDLARLKKERDRYMEQYAVMEARLEALNFVLLEFDHFGRIEKRSNSPNTGKGISRRGRDYFAAVLDLIGKRFPNATQYFKAIAHRAPKPNGKSPNMRAPWGWFKSNGYITGKEEGFEELTEFRSRLEGEAKRLEKEELV